jgi:hypothetical protein
MALTSVDSRWARVWLPMRTAGTVRRQSGSALNFSPASTKPSDGATRQNWPLPRVPRKRYYGQDTRPYAATARAGDFPVEGTSERKARMASCGNIDDETIELHAMGRLEEGSLRRHLDSCDSCRAKVAEQRSFIEDLRRCLRELREREKSSSQSGGPDHSPPQDQP